MNALQRQGNIGFMASIGALGVLVLAALLVQFLFVSPVVERERAGLSKSLHVQQMLNVLGSRDDKTRSELMNHLSILRDGGELLALNGKSYSISATDSNALIGAANAIDEVIGQGGHSSLRTLTGNLVLAHQQSWQDTVKKVKWFRYAVGFNALLLLGFIFSQFYRRLKRTRLLWNATLRENKSILEATKDGLFLIKPTLQVGSVQSSAVKTIFGIGGPISGDFFDFLKRLVSPEDLIDAKDYISLMLEGRGKQSLLSDLNPLKEVEITVENSLGFVSTKYLNFDFARNELNPNAGLLVSVSDITKEVELKRELAQASRGNDERFSLLMGSIVNDSDEVKTFYKSTHEGLREINDLLRDDNQQHDDNIHKLEDIFRTVHRLKGNAGAVGVSLIETSAHQFESKIQELLEQPQIDGKQILSLTVHLKHMISELDFLEQLSAKVNAKQSHAKPVLATVNTNPVVQMNDVAVSGSSNLDAAETPQAEMSELERFTMEVAGRQGKMVKVEKVGFDDFDISKPAEAEIDALCIQLIRNSVAHGIELPDERRELGKPSEGRIVINMKMRDETRVLLRVWDDGRGFDFDAIRRIAVERDLVAADVAAVLSKSELVRFIFVSGFSTREEASIDAGRGVGLDIVKESVVKLGGKISVKSSRGISSQVTIQLPISALSLTERKNLEPVQSERANAL